MARRELVNSRYFEADANSERMYVAKSTPDQDEIDVRRVALLCMCGSVAVETCLCLSRTHSPRILGWTAHARIYIMNGLSALKRYQ
jgi:hypothetical protein